MCGRFTVAVDLKTLIKYLSNEYHIDKNVDHFQVPTYNVAPSSNVIAIIHDGQAYQAGYLSWGYLPPYATDDKVGLKLYNAKAETIADKPAFIDSLTNRRCVILTDGFFEWYRNGKNKIPYRFTMNDNSLFAMAGIYSIFTRSDGTSYSGCAIITTEANQLVGQIHNRMPVILQGNQLHQWLYRGNDDLQMLSSLLTPFDPSLMNAYEVSNYVNKATNNDIKCIEPV
jgi:putative SOS response-associated peptidase YedK